MDNQQLQLVTLATEINMLHDSAQQAAMTAVQYAAKCGEKLIQAKAACAHGEWLPWLEANCKVNRNQASKYMRLSKEMPELSNDKSTYNFTGIEAAIAYLSAPDEVKAQVDESAKPVGGIFTLALADDAPPFQPPAFAVPLPSARLRYFGFFVR